MMEENQVAKFSELPLGPTLLATLDEIGYETPTPIQAAFIPEAMTGIDLIGQAKTGTGKTAAFLIPIIEKIEENGKPQALVIVPTRELAEQVRLEGERLKGIRGLSVAALYGGHQLRKQMDQLRNGVELVVGTPGRLLDMMRRGCLRTENIRFVVLDEADRMLDIGFRPDIERILRRLPERRQSFLLSATMAPEVQRLAHRYMDNPHTIRVSAEEIAADSIEQRYFTVEEHLKLNLLLRLLVREKPRQCIIFCQMKSGVRKLANELGRRIRGVMGMQGDLQQKVRNRVMADFRAGNIRILVATDVVGRGIDVQGISHVINYDIPEESEAYVHRIGRTGRMGRGGKAFTFVTPNQGRELTAIERLTKQMLIPDEIEGFVAFQPKRRETISC